MGSGAGNYAKFWWPFLMSQQRPDCRAQKTVGSLAHRRPPTSASQRQEKGLRFGPRSLQTSPYTRRSILTPVQRFGLLTCDVEEYQSNHYGSVTRTNFFVERSPMPNQALDHSHLVSICCEPSATCSRSTTAPPGPIWFRIGTSRMNWPRHSRIITTRRCREK